MLANSEPTDRHRWQVLALLGTAFFMTILDGTILLTALPSIEADLDLHGAGLQWTVTAYALAFSGLLLFCGRTADLLGRRRVFLAGIALRVLASLLCGSAWSGEVLVAARALQGVSAAVIAPAALSLLMVTFPEGPERNKALGIWGSLGGIGATAGLLLGGVITEALGWEWIFLVNVPIGIALFVLAPFRLPAGRGEARARRFDAAGAVTVTAALVLLVYGIVRVPGGVTAWPFVASAGLFGLFVLVERRSQAPLLPFAVLRNRSLVGGNLLILTAGMSVDGMLITLTSHVQQVFGWSAFRFGLVAAVMTVSSIAGAQVSQRVATRRGVGPIAVAGPVLLALACLLLTRVSADTGSLEVLLVALFVFGAGMGGAFVGAQVAGLSGVSEGESGLAAGLIDTSFSLGTALGVAICTSAALAGGASLTQGHRAAFGVAAGFGVLGLVVAVTLLRRRAPAETASLSA